MNNLCDFKVICDETNNSKEDIENNILKIDVYIKLPLYRINFRVDKEGNVTYTDSNNENEPVESSMNTAKIIAVTQPKFLIKKPDVPRSDSEFGMSNLYHEPSAEEFIAYTARVSNPSNQHNTLTTPKLLKYLIAHKHWSPFEMVDVVMEIETTRDIAHQIIRHRSFSFQEFSQRYADPTKDMGFVTREARLQDAKNRQNSIETEDVVLQKEWQYAQEHIADQCQSVYNDFIKRGIAKEQARAVLPEGLTKTRLYMKGSLRSWIHYIDVRAEEGTQKEHREVAIAAREEILKQFPSLRNYWFEQEIKEELEKSLRDWWRPSWA